MLFSPYMLFTIVLLMSTFMLLFILITCYGNTATRVPIGVVYLCVLVTGLRLLIPIEIDALSYEINSYGIMARINDFWKHTIMELPFYTVTISTLLYIIWIAVAVLLLVRFISGRLRLHHRLSYIPQVYDKQISKQLEKIYAHYSFSFKPKVIRTCYPASPAETGYFRQVILINGGEYTDEEIYYILIHEMAHFYLKNNLATLSVEILKIIFWWNPIVYFFSIHIKNLMETYADKVVVNGLSHQGRLNYMNCLLKVYKLTSASEHKHCLSGFVNPMADSLSRSFLEKRFIEITKAQSFSRVKSLSLIFLSLFYCILTIFIVFQPAYNPPESELAPINLTEANSYIVQEGDMYVLYYKGEPLILSPNAEDLEAILNNGN